jgi:hypothetical protein
MLPLADLTMPAIFALGNHEYRSGGEKGVSQWLEFYSGPLGIPTLRNSALTHRVCGLTGNDSVCASLCIAGEWV